MSVHKHENKTMQSSLSVVHILDYFNFCTAPVFLKKQDHLLSYWRFHKAQQNISCFHDTLTGRHFHWTNHSTPTDCTCTMKRVCLSWIYSVCCVFSTQLYLNIMGLYRISAGTLGWCDRTVTKVRGVWSVVEGNENVRTSNLPL